MNESKLRGWGKRIQARISALEEKTLEGQKIGEPILHVCRHPLRPDQLQKVYDFRAQVWYVQHWTYSHTDEEGRHFILSLETGKVEAIRVWMALNAVSRNTSHGPMPPYDEWLEKIIEGDTTEVKEA